MSSHNSQQRANDDNNNVHLATAVATDPEEIFQVIINPNGQTGPDRAQGHLRTFTNVQPRLWSRIRPNVVPQFPTRIGQFVRVQLSSSTDPNGPIDGWISIRWLTPLAQGDSNAASSTVLPNQRSGWMTRPVEATTRCPSINQAVPLSSPRQLMVNLRQRQPLPLTSYRDLGQASPAARKRKAEFESLEQAGRSKALHQQSLRERAARMRSANNHSFQQNDIHQQQALRIQPGPVSATEQARARPGNWLLRGMVQQRGPFQLQDQRQTTRARLQPNHFGPGLAASSYVQPRQATWYRPGIIPFPQRQYGPQYGIQTMVGKPSLQNDTVTSGHRPPVTIDLTSSPAPQPRQQSQGQPRKRKARDSTETDPAPAKKRAKKARSNDEPKLPKHNKGNGSYWQAEKAAAREANDGKRWLEAEEGHQRLKDSNNASQRKRRALVAEQTAQGIATEKKTRRKAEKQPKPDTMPPSSAFLLDPTLRYRFPDAPTDAEGGHIGSQQPQHGSLDARTNDEQGHIGSYQTQRRSPAASTNAADRYMGSQQPDRHGYGSAGNNTHIPAWQDPVHGPANLQSQPVYGHQGSMADYADPGYSQTQSVQVPSQPLMVGPVENGFATDNPVDPADNGFGMEHSVDPALAPLAPYQPGPLVSVPDQLQSDQGTHLANNLLSFLNGSDTSRNTSSSTADRQSTPEFPEGFATRTAPEESETDKQFAKADQFEKDFEKDFEALEDA